MMYQLKDLAGNTIFMANEQVFAVIKEMLKLNKRMCRFMILIANLLFDKIEEIT